MRLDLELRDNQYLKPYRRKLNELSKYLGTNMLGSYEIKFLPYTGGLEDQPGIWLEDITEIIDALNSLNN